MLVDAVRRYAMGWRHRRPSVPPSQVYVPLVFAPGEARQLDWSREQVVPAGKPTMRIVRYLTLAKLLARGRKN